MGIDQDPKSLRQILSDIEAYEKSEPARRADYEKGRAESESQAFLKFQKDLEPKLLKKIKNLLSKKHVSDIQKLVSGAPALIAEIEGIPNTGEVSTVAEFQISYAENPLKYNLQSHEWTTPHVPGTFILSGFEEVVEKLTDQAQEHINPTIIFGYFVGRPRSYSEVIFSFSIECAEDKMELKGIGWEKFDSTSNGVEKLGQRLALGIKNREYQRLPSKPDDHGF